MKRRTLVGTFAITVAALSFPSQVSAADDPVRVAVLPVDSSMEASYASVMGFAERAHLGLTVEEISGGAAIMAAIIGGSIDLGNVNTFSILAARDKGVPVVMVAGATIYSSTTWNAALVVAEDSAIRNGAGFAGKTIAISGLRSLPQYSAMAWIDRNGGNSKLVRFLEMPLPNMQYAIAEHHVDAANMSEPFASRAVAAGGRILCHVDDGIAPLWLQNAWVSSAAWVAANPDIVRRYRALMYRTAIWANSHQRESAEILSKVSKVDLEVIRSMRRAHYAEDNGGADLLEPVIDVALRYGLIAKRPAARDLFAP